MIEIPTGEELFGGRSGRDIVLMAMELLADENRWNVGAVAVDENGESVKPRDPRAVRWTMEGALARVSNDWGIVPPSLLHFLDVMFNKEQGHEECDLPLWFANDFHFDHQGVLDFLWRAALSLADA